MTASQPHQVEDWIAEAGLGWLPPDEQNRLADLVYERLEERVGARLSSGMTDEQLEEFEILSEGDDQQLVKWLEGTAPDFLDDPIYTRLRETMPDAPASLLLREYSSMRWLRQNAPGYADVVNAARDEIKEELRALAAHLAARKP